MFEDGSPEEVALALKNVAEARRQSVDTSQTSNADWEKCYHLLEQSKMPALPMLLMLLSELGLKLTVTVKQGQPT
ncbi:hypothetical protein AM1_3065 [Acaryochloris marina MBIC11017]|uniref:Uncharacterized protein n=1 Tax=Acaryochloris marina (strain MBIC 11017) TaxID=329726 RepID=B0CDJ2_ACAM1|nr:hypothetical protein [Acaryochloris marina]ABW28061.1 hypothetical protein AM1_3065 [Acaryochloris marina MBIC11017]